MTMFTETTPERRSFAESLDESQLIGSMWMLWFLAATFQAIGALFGAIVGIVVISIFQNV